MTVSDEMSGVDGMSSPTHRSQYRGVGPSGEGFNLPPRGGAVWICSSCFARIESNTFRLLEDDDAVNAESFCLSCWSLVETLEGPPHEVRDISEIRDAVLAAIEQAQCE